MLIDASIIIELFLEQEKAENCRVILNQIASGEKKAVISVFTIDSIAIVLESKKISYERIYSLIEKIIKSRGLTFYKPTLKDRIQSFNLINKYKLSYEDALTLQCAISTNCKEILSFDNHFNKVKEIQRIEP